MGRKESNQTNKRSARRTIDSKIDENRCKQKYELIQVMCILYRYIIVRPVKRDWAVLSKDTPVDIFHLKIGKTECIYSPVKSLTAIYLYTCSGCEKKASQINLDNKETE